MLVYQCEVPNRSYPCWVVPLSKLRALERLPVHEDALQAEYLDELTQLSTQPSCAYSFCEFHVAFLPSIEPLSHKISPALRFQS